MFAGLESTFLNVTVNASSHPAWWIVGLSYLSGVASTLLPCCIGMLPILIGYMGGYADVDNREQVLIQCVCFVMGLATIMTVLGILATSLGLTFGALTGPWLFYGAGTIAVLMGLKLLGIITIPLPQLVKTLPESGIQHSGLKRFIAPYIMGLTFGAAATPCGTPFLAGILGMLSTTKNVVLGGASLFAYACGQGTLLIIAGLFTGLLKHIAIMRHVGQTINQLSGVVFLLGGSLLILEGAGLLSKTLIQLGLL